MQPIITWEVRVCRAALLQGADLEGVDMDVQRVVVYACVRSRERRRHR